MESINEHTRYYVPQLCYQRDISFNLEVLFGLPFDHQKSILNLSIDINSPWSWATTRDCKTDENKLKKFPKNLSTAKSLKPLDQGCPQASMVLTKDQQKKITQDGVILGDEFLFKGGFVYNQLNFLAYDPIETQNFVDVLENEVSSNLRLENHEEVIKIPEFQLLAVNQILDRSYDLSDGAIGLGFKETNQYNIVENTNFLDVLVQGQKDGIVETQQFGIFINDKGVYNKEHIISFGNLNKKFALKENISNIYWISVVTQNLYFWALNLQSIKIHFPSIYQQSSKNVQMGDEIIETGQGVTPAILTMNSSYIYLPQSLIKQVIQYFNSYDNPNCKIVDNKFQVVWCESFSIDHEMAMNFEFNFTEQVKKDDGTYQNEQKTISIVPQNLIGKCHTSQKISNTGDRYPCFLKLRVSKDNRIILGEPFLKQHYSVFDQENKRVGFIMASDDQYWGLSMGSINLHLGDLFKILSYTLMVILIAIVTFLCCMTPLKNGIRNMKEVSMRLKHDASFQDVKSLTQSDKEQPNPYEEVEAAMREQAMKEIQKMEQKMVDDEHNITINSLNDTSIASFDTYH